jgi:hypothetical protein
MTASVQTSNLVERVRGVMETVSSSNETYRVNFTPGRITHPIPFFGKLHTAKVVTIGVNPSADEFVGRDWPEHLDAAALTERLLHYFDSPPGPHPWFKPWIHALALLRIDYARGEAAHLDLSPRATVSMSSVPDTNLFLGMMSHDIRWLFEFLQECNLVRLLMAAGTVTDRWYLNQFLARHSRQFQFKIHPSPQFTDRCALYEFTHLGKTLPLFFSSVSPSDSERAHVLVENVRNKRDQLRDHLN